MRDATKTPHASDFAAVKSRYRALYENLECREPLRSSPNLSRDFDHEPELRFLLRGRDAIPRRCARESALGTNRQTIELDILRRFVDTPLQRVFRFELGKFARHQSQHHRFIARHEAQRFERSGARRVVFKKI